jgi:hypothetical protein
MMDLRYPIGPFVRDNEPLSAEQRSRFIGEIATAPEELRKAVTGLTAPQFDTPYRPGGWTARQVAHHIPDSHINAYVLAQYAWHGRHHVAHITSLRERQGWTA